MLSKVDLSRHYSEMEAVFTGTLGVSVLTLEMVYEELQTKGTSDIVSIDDMKRELRQFNSLLPKHQSPLDWRPILASRVFPVRCAQGTVRLMSATSSDWAVIDAKPLEKKFHGLAKMLDFSIEEVRDLTPFLEWTGLYERCLSRKVTETIIEVTPAAEDSETAQKILQNIESKAYALCR
jgi:hypothetical protein